MVLASLAPGLLSELAVKGLACGGGAGGSFGNLGAAHSLSLTQHYRQWYDRHHYLSQSLHPRPMYLEYRSSYSYSSNSSAD